MLKFFKAMLEASRKGKQYRLEKYGKPQTILESFEESKKFRQKEKLKKQLWKNSFPYSIDSVNSLEYYLCQFEQLDNWAGSRYVREKNPYLSMSTVQWRNKFGNRPRPIVKQNSIARVCSYTNTWEPLSD